MSAKKKRSRHRIPIAQVMKSDPITPEYQAEIDRTMEKAETAYRQAERRLEQQQARLRKVKKKPATRTRDREVREIEALIELRRMELEKYHRMLTATGAPSTARGKGSHRHVPAKKAL